MSVQELIHGIFRPDSDNENRRCWAEALPYVSDDAKLSPDVEKRVVEIIGEKLQFMLDYMDLGSAREYYRYYQAQLWEYLRKYALTYNKDITDMKGFNAFLNQYVVYFALDERRRDLRIVDKELNLDTTNIQPGSPELYDEEFVGDDYSEDELLDSLMDTIEDYVDNLNINEVMAQYLQIIATRIEKKVGSESSKSKNNACEKKRGLRYDSYIVDLYDFYVEGLTQEKIAEARHYKNKKYMGTRLERARMYLVEYIVPEIRHVSRNHFIWLQKHYFNRQSGLLTPKEISLLDYFFVEQLDLFEISKKLKISKAQMGIVLYKTLRKYYKIKIALYNEHKIALRDAKSKANIDILTFEQSLINKK